MRDGSAVSEDGNQVRMTISLLVWGYDAQFFSRSGGCVSFGRLMAKLFLEGLTNPLDWFNFSMLQNTPFCLDLQKGPVSLKCKWGYSANHPLSAGSFTELQSIAWGWNVPMPTFLECTYWLEKKSNALASALLYFVSFIFDHPVHCATECHFPLSFVQCKYPPPVQRRIHDFSRGGASQKRAPFNAQGRQNMEAEWVSAGHCETIALHLGDVRFQHSIQTLTATFL